MTPSRLILLLPILVCVTQALTPLNETYQSIDGKRVAAIYPFKPKVYDINMDDGYEDKWREVMKEMGHEIPELFDVFWKQVGLSEDVINSITFDVLVQYDEEYAKEIQAISNLVNYSFARVVFLNAFFDVTTECAAIIVQDKNNNLIHARNLDFAFEMTPIITTMMFHGRFIKGGKILYEAVTKVGQIGLLTAIKDGKYSLNLNQNMEHDINAERYWRQIKDVITKLYQQYHENHARSIELSTHKLKHEKMYLSPVFIARRAIETASTYEEIVDILKHTPTISKVYYVVAGIHPGEGTIIDKLGTATEVTSLTNSNDDIWYLVQTNYARSLPDASDDNRADASIALLESIGRDKITKESLLEVMKTYPVFNNCTIHTTIMYSKANHIDTTIWGWSDHRVETAVHNILEA